MEFQNDWAIKKWSLALSDNFPLDKVTFILSSLLPLSQIETRGADNFLVVELSDIRKYTNLAKQGCDLLVSEGVAKWVNDDRGQIDYKKIAIGTTYDYINASYFFEAKGRLKQTLKTPQEAKKSTRNKPKIDSDFSETIEILDEWFGKYKVFCNKVNLHSKSEKIFSKIKTVLDNVKATGEIKDVELLTYLDSVNAMVYDWMDVPNSYTNIKLRQTAKNVITRTTADNIIKIVPYYVENYPNIAKAGFEETNIYNLNFHFTSMLIKATGKNKSVSRKKGYDNDEL